MPSEPPTPPKYIPITPTNVGGLQVFGYSLPGQAPRLSGTPSKTIKSESEGFDLQGAPSKFQTNYKIPNQGPKQLTPQQLREQLPEFKGTQALEKSALAGGLIAGGVATGAAIAPAGGPAAAVPVAISLGLASSIALSDIEKEGRRLFLSDKPVETFDPNDRFTETERQLVNSKEYEAIAREGYKGLERQLTGGNLIDNIVTALPGSGLVDERTRRLFFDAARSKAKELGYSDAKANAYANLAVTYDLTPGQTAALANALGVEYLGNAASANLYPGLAKQSGLVVNGEKISLANLTPTQLRSLSPVGIEKLNIIKNPLALVGAKAGAVAGASEGVSEVIARDIEFNRFGESNPDSLSVNALGLRPTSFEGRLASQLEREGVGFVAGAGTGAAFQSIIGGQQVSDRPVSDVTRYAGYVLDQPEKAGDILSDVLSPSQLVYTNIPKEFARRGPVKAGTNVFSISSVLGLATSQSNSTSASSLSNTLAQSQSQTNSQGQALAQTKSQAQAQSNTQAQAQANSQTQAQSNVLSQATANALGLTNTQNFAESFANAQAQAQAEGQAQAQSQTLAEAQAQSQAEAEAQAEAETQAQSNTQAQAETLTNATTPGYPLIPLPPLFNFGGGGGGQGRGKRVIYFDELGRAFSLLENGARRVYGINQRRQVPARRRPVVRRRKRK